ncbi:hypothetical protein AVEN_198145-1 [Araneus ventricosus]|uniref:Uncharacterized protein n=1 Tax=Araneus ventricosus TaxID=182803 RepID=A0A4Y2JEG3_ARAVE|nr:hypothetical protein AVEN_198145-1 [Araneus ventricosus]
MQRTVDKSAVRFDVAPSNSVKIAKEQLLSNVEKKKEFLKFLSIDFKKAKFLVLQAPSDADVLIVETAKTEAESGHSAIIVDIDSELLVFIAALAQPQATVYHMLVLGNFTTASNVYCSRELHKGFGHMTKALIFMHAFMGCDTTSAVYRKGPNSGFYDRKMQKVVDIFNISNASQDSVEAAGEKFIVHLYGGESSDGVYKTRYKKYIQTVGKKPPNYVMILACLPPTSFAS